MLKEFVEYIAKSIVDHPDAVRVTEIETDKAFILELRLDEEDYGKITNTKKRADQALRTLVNFAAAKVQKRAVLAILCDYGPG